MNLTDIIYEVSEGVAMITLNRPDTLNSFNEAMHHSLHLALDSAAKDSQVRAVYLTGAGRAFCAGQDLSDPMVKPAEPMPNLGNVIESYYNNTVKRLYHMEKPVVCAVNGIAAGAGANIPLACDFVIAAKSAKFVQAFCKIGLIPDSAGTWLLPRLVGLARAKQLAMLGNPLSAEQAVNWGLIFKAVDDDLLHEESIAFAKQLATQPTLALTKTKQALDLSFNNSLEDQLDVERDIQTRLGNSDDYKEGVNAFIEKRQPDYKGC
ncbi:MULTISPECIES: 2-(1,2-epoxy-1,2-dihydrophenyl)acetyl-CoA isomerase PaaG [unclassified Marinobacterium]|jgi:2-(1,2-epoxy-1,2-dihydrophenyl)acetyl-CoA isomerase|uniref:2-(1,2-epoxy-1,2-dihydrophenyl)acetyl-CoA isomerase PaaG n=1 Tax=unclassified Marinobacterium TaxID=2644139 RepID=UPI001568A6C5|nr:MULTISPECIES: 2-(1,2-epoxy-1,2-dihydrophenyl)acetyl-CoA isomerase PaaG [unclassified Marinobacterium]NRP09281.1 1,2-epoxyphenylacetyl-CoA isomerase [Marinobacterium sp. xm-g-48]NRP35625.1 1,2-epoxyphenylacetyl-CoA isomerase [Marinobacterium sp. xm-d-579]NRP46075.1 1,2-epoxyphenylacetyl-CoA isomerase [Marinobacterium sp. xm-d-543]NRP82188.1 1,2-epoxyphenylacetyl-CoA isomerase [Marinobacterium sp. xm-d-509]NRQ01100.1 1,2-epoxyphenylacetyl-CoA isomerase [Marinobacterium sp. xm-d-530]